MILPPSVGFPPCHIPAVPFTFEILQIIFPYSVMVTGVVLVENLLTLNLIDQIMETRGDSSREGLPQGGGNRLSGLFSGMVGCAILGRS